MAYKNDSKNNPYIGNNPINLVDELDSYINQVSIDSSLSIAISNGIGNKTIELTPVERVTVGTIISQLLENEFLFDSVKTRLTVINLFNKLV